MHEQARASVNLNYPPILFNAHYDVIDSELGDYASVDLRIRSCVQGLHLCGIDLTQKLIDACHHH